jgi:hypothetical protein
VHFEGGVSVFFSARFLYEQRDILPNQLFLIDGARSAEANKSDS